MQLLAQSIEAGARGEPAVARFARAMRRLPPRGRRAA